MSLHTRVLFASLLLSSACAAAPTTAEAPQCPEGPSIAVADPVTTPPVSVVPEETELVSVRLFVVTEGKGEAALPQAIATSDTCTRNGCDLLLAPMMLGRDRQPLELELGSTDGDHYFSLNARPTVQGEHIQLTLDADFFATTDEHPARKRRFEFQGALEPGVLTHVGTFHAFDHRGHDVGPEVFAMVERATSSAD